MVLRLKTIFVLIFFAIIATLLALPVYPDKRIEETTGSNPELKESRTTDPFWVSIPAVAEFSDWHNETRQRRIYRGSRHNFMNNSIIPQSQLSTVQDQSQRDKALRLQAINLYVLEMLGRSNVPVSSVESDVQDRNSWSNTNRKTEFTNQRRPDGNSRVGRIFPGQLESFLASCDLPSQVDEEAWTQPDVFRIFFNLSHLDDLSPRTEMPTTTTTLIPPFARSTDRRAIESINRRNSVPQGQFGGLIKSNLGNITNSNTTSHSTPDDRQFLQVTNIPVNIISAKLRLYKIGRGPNAEMPRFDLPKTSEFCNNTNEEIIQFQHQQQRTTLTQSSSAIVSEIPEERIFVKIYWYTAPVTRHHYKKKLLYSRTLLVKESGWIDFDIQKAAKAWFESKINYGLAVEIENEDNDLVDVRTYFSNVNCPRVAVNPNVSAKRVSSGINGRSRTTQTPPTVYPLPILEICTLTLPTSGIESSARGDGVISFSMSSFSRQKSKVESQGEQQESNERTFWMSDDPNVHISSTPSPLPLPLLSHRRRHHHGTQRGLPSRRDWIQSDSADIGSDGIETSTRFSLDDDHPIRRIFSTARSYLSREEMEKRSKIYKQRLLSNVNLTSTWAESSEPTFLQPIIIEAENIVIENNPERKGER